MTTLENGLWTPGGAQPPLENGAHLSIVSTEIPSQFSREGILLPEWQPIPEFGHEVESTKNLDVRWHNDYGTSWLDAVKMTNGTRYHVLFGEPKARRTDIPVVFTTEWCTDIEGINTDRAFNFMQMGYPVVLVGPERNKAVTLAETSYNMHKILDHTERRGYYEPRVVLLAGASRGGMAGMGFRAQADRLGRHVIYFDFTDPCVAMPIDLSLRGLWEKRHMMTHESVSAAVNIGRLTVGRALHYARTGSSPLQYAKQNALVMSALMSGESGRLGRQIPLDARGHINWMTLSDANDQDIYEAMFENHRFITSSEQRDGHVGGIASREDFMGRAGRFGNVVRQLADGAKTDELDFSFLEAA
jgi:hypothetical protein